MRELLPILKPMPNIVKNSDKVHSVIMNATALPIHLLHSLEHHQPPAPILIPLWLCILIQLRSSCLQFLLASLRGHIYGSKTHQLIHSKDSCYLVLLTIHAHRNHRPLGLEVLRRSLPWRMLVLVTLVLRSGGLGGGGGVFGYFFEDARGGIFFGGVDGHVGDVYVVLSSWIKRRGVG